MNYGIVDDIHGHSARLKSLLAKLGSEFKDGAYRHPEGRMAVLRVDLKDRGPDQLEPVDIVQ